MQFRPSTFHRWCLSLLLFALITVLFPRNMAFGAEQGLNLDVKSAILVEASTGRILYSFNEDVPLPPASMTKMMTEYLILEALANKKISWEDTVTTSDYGFFLGRSGGSRVFLNENEKRTVRELYEAMAIYSANDATVTLAEYVAGSEENFVRLMNEKAKEFGMTNTHFLTSTGLPAADLGAFAPSIPGDQKMSARDAAILAKELITTFPEALKISSIPKAVFREGEENPIEMINWNWMLPGLWYEMEGVDGLKTGYTEEAKNCFTGTAKRNGMRLISVVMGAPTKAKRFEETRKLLEYGFQNYSLEKVLAKNSTVPGFETAPVKKGVQLTVPVVTAKDVIIPVETGEKDAYQPEVSFTTVEAPVEKGQVVGTVSFKHAEEEETYLRPSDKESIKVNLIASKPVKKASWLRLLFRGIKNLLSSIFG